MSDKPVGSGYVVLLTGLVFLVVAITTTFGLPPFEAFVSAAGPTLTGPRRGIFVAWFAMVAILFVLWGGVRIQRGTPTIGIETIALVLGVLAATGGLLLAK